MHAAWHTMRRLLIGLAAALIGSQCVASASSSAQRGGTFTATTAGERCPPAGQRVVDKNKYLVVYTSRPGGLDEGVLNVCDRSGRYPGTGLGEYTNPSSVTLRGHSLAYSDTTCEVDGSCAVYVDEGTAAGGGISVVAASFALPFVTQTVIAADHALVWIACHATSGEVGTFVPVSPQCLHGDRLRDVYAASAAMLRQGPAQQKPVLLDHGHGIKARSLRIHHGRVYWTHSHKSRSARLPT
jgi:hypothetical protein